jgi:hypothetical protein
MKPQDGAVGVGKAKKQEAVMTDPDTCCCGHPYTERAGESSDRCPVGARQLCAECATDGKGRCPTHRVPVKRK